MEKQTTFGDLIDGAEFLLHSIPGIGFWLLTDIYVKAKPSDDMPKYYNCYLKRSNSWCTLPNNAIVSETEWSKVK